MGLFISAKILAAFMIIFLGIVLLPKYCAADPLHIDETVGRLQQIYEKPRTFRPVLFRKPP